MDLELSNPHVSITCAGTRGMHHHTRFFVVLGIKPRICAFPFQLSYIPILHNHLRRSLEDRYVQCLPSAKSQSQAQHVLYEEPSGPYSTLTALINN